MNIFKDFIAPTGILTLICLVAVGALVWVYGITQPIIDARALEAESAAMREVLSGADVFSTVELGELPEGVTTIYQASNGAGVAVAAEAKGYSSTPVSLMVGIKNDGSIERVRVIMADETPDIGTRALTDAYLDSFVGKTADTYTEVDSVSGATLTSAAVKNVLKSAFNGYAVSTGGEVIAEPEKGLTAALIEQYYPGITPEPVEVEEGEAFICGDAGYIVIGEGKGFAGPVKVAVLFDAEGVILWTVVTESNESPGIGDRVESDDYTALYVGKTNAEDVDILAGATRSSLAYQSAVNAAVAQLEILKEA
jgi:electron transport complex protein RnfG